MITIRTCKDQAEWDEAVLGENGHPLQLWGWGEVKAAHNWNAERVIISDDDTLIGGAQLLIRALPWPFNALVYIPRGPFGREDHSGEVLERLAEHAKTKYHAVAVTIEPDWSTTQPPKGWKKSSNTILIPRTLILDLHTSEDDLLNAMTKKTRQYIRKSASEAMQVRKVKTREELDLCLEIYRQTANRAGFAIHGNQYYYDIFDNLNDYSLVMAVFKDNKPISFLWLVMSEQTAFELYGGMNDEGQSLRANYTLKWQTIQLIKKWGIQRYDFNGLLNDGVSTFKQGFASHEDMLVGTYDKPLSVYYEAWTKGLPLAKKVVRKIKNR